MKSKIVRQLGAMLLAGAMLVTSGLRQTCTQPKHPSRRMNILYWKNRDTKSKDKNFPFTFGFKA